MLVCFDKINTELAERSFTRIAEHVAQIVIAVAGGRLGRIGALDASE